MRKTGKPTNAVNSKYLGELAESIFQTEALKRNFVVSKPWGDNQSYDYVLENNHGKLFKIQVKSSARYAKGDRGYNFNVGKGSSGKNAKKDGSGLDANGEQRKAGKAPYKLGEVDFYCCYHHIEKNWHLLPERAIESEDDPGVLLQNIKVSMAEGTKYSSYKDQWEVFNESL